MRERGVRVVFSRESQVQRVQRIVSAEVGGARIVPTLLRMNKCRPSDQINAPERAAHLAVRPTSQRTCGAACAMNTASRGPRRCSLR